jgi:hypothetical protein
MMAFRGRRLVAREEWKRRICAGTNVPSMRPTYYSNDIDSSVLLRIVRRRLSGTSKALSRRPEQ